MIKPRPKNKNKNKNKKKNMAQEFKIASFTCSPDEFGKTSEFMYSVTTDKAKQYDIIKKLNDNKDQIEELACLEAIIGNSIPLSLEKMYGQGELDSLPFFAYIKELLGGDNVEILPCDLNILFNTLDGICGGLNNYYKSYEFILNFAEASREHARSYLYSRKDQKVRVTFTSSDGPDVTFEVLAAEDSEAEDNDKTFVQFYESVCDGTDLNLHVVS